jgi:hypothetical protein
VGPDEQLRAAVGQLSHGVGIPNFLIKALAHGLKRRLRRGRKLHLRRKNVKAASLEMKTDLRRC